MSPNQGAVSLRVPEQFVSPDFKPQFMETPMLNELKYGDWDV